MLVESGIEFAKDFRVEQRNDTRSEKELKGLEVKKTLSLTNHISMFFTKNNPFDMALFPNRASSENGKVQCHAWIVKLLQSEVGNGCSEGLGNV